MGSVFVHRVELSNYRSLAHCSVSLRPLTVLVGRNGSGKSNFLDALRLVAESLSTSLEHALRERGGMDEVRRRSAGHPTQFGVRLELSLPAGGAAIYALSVGALPDRSFEVLREEIHVWSAARSGGAPRSWFKRDRDRVSSSLGAVPLGRVELDRLHLPLLGSLPEFRPLYEGLARMSFYQLQPQRIGGLQDPDAGDRLLRDGSNLAAVIRRMKKRDPERLARVEEHLHAIVSDVSRIDVRAFGPKEQVTVLQDVDDQKPWSFPGSSLSDGTLRALGVLTAAFQPGKEGVPGLYGIEEPEVAIHPGAVPRLSAALREASEDAQILLTTHSPDLLSDEDYPAEDILVVEKQRGSTTISELAQETREIIRERLCTPGELLRQSQLQGSSTRPTAPRRSGDLFRLPRPTEPETR